MITNLEHQSHAIADRLDSLGVGFIDPATIMIFLNMLAACWGQNDSPDPAEAHATLVKADERNPEKLRRRAARRIYWESQDVAGEQYTREAARAMADATIDQALSQSPDTMHACCAEAITETDV